MALLKICGVGGLGQNTVEEPLTPHVSICRMKAGLAWQQIPHGQTRLHHGMGRELGKLHSDEIGSGTIGGCVAVAGSDVRAVVDAEHLAGTAGGKHDRARATGNECASEDAIE